MPSPIVFDAERKTFVLSLRSSFYALRVLPEGQLVHVCSGPTDGGAVTLEGLEHYEDPSYIWDEQGKRWELPTFGDVSYHDVALRAAFPEPAEVRPGDDPSHVPVRDLRLRYASHDIVEDAHPALSDAPAGPRGGVRPTLVIHLRDIGYEFHARLCYRVTAEHDVIERWLEIENRTERPVRIESLAFGTVHFPQAEYDLIRPGGAWGREFVPVRQPLVQGETLVRQLGLNTGHTVNPFYLVAERGRTTEDSGPAFFGLLAYSGNWAFRFETLLTGASRVQGGYEPTGFALTLEPGAAHTTPAFVHGVAPDGLGGASRRLHAFARDYVLPDASPLRPVLYNSWEATYFDLSQEGQIQLARRAAEIGVELFCVDDGWFGARRHDRAGLGDWTVSADVFPEGLGPLIAEVKRLGMRFGLWVEPEMVNPDSDLYRAHPDWALHFPGRPRTEGRTQLILDFGRPEVVEHISDALHALIAEYDIDFFKWDMNRYVAEPGSAAGSAVWRRHVEGVYGIMDSLRRAKPGLEIESCSGGGGRVDLGILARTDQVWTSDNTDALDRVFIEDGYSLAYPLRAMSCWVTHEENHQTGRQTALDLRFDVAMRGVLGIGTSLNTLSDEELARYREKIAFYKAIRPIVQTGDLYRLSTTLDERLSDYSAWQIVLPDGSKSVYSFVMAHQLQGRHVGPFRLRGLTPDAVYVAADSSGQEVGRFSGRQLMSLGLPGDSRWGGINCAVRSRTVLLERVA